MNRPAVRCLRSLLALATLALAAPRARAQGPRDLVARAVQAMGGEAALRATSGIGYDYYLTTWTLGQSELAESPPRATQSAGRLVHDYRGSRRAFMQETRLLTGATTRQRFVVAPTLGLNEVNGQPTPLAPGAVVAQQRLLRLSTDRLLLAMLDAPAALSAVPVRTLRGLPHDGVRFAGRDTVTVFFDRVTGLPLVMETVTDDPILGDRSTQIWMTRWQSAGAILQPRQYDRMVNGRIDQHVINTGVTIDPPISDSLFAIPDSIAARAQPIGTAAPPITVNLNQLAPSVWRAETGNYHTLVVEQPDQLVLVEGPVSTQRSRAVLDTLRSRFPAKRIGSLVMTHHHWDHTSGLREFIAEGIPVVTLEGNAAFVRQVAAARRTVVPDLQAQRRRNATVRAFTDSTVVGSGETRVVLYRLPTIHAEGLLGAWVPAARVLFTSDVVNPPAAMTPSTSLNAVGSAELVAFARARGLTPDLYAGGHGAAVRWTDIERAASPAAGMR